LQYETVAKQGTHSLRLI